MWVLDGHSALAEYQQESDSWANFVLEAIFHDLVPDSVDAVFQDLRGTMWFGTNRGLATFDSNRAWKFYTNRNSALPGNEVTAISVDQSG
jgi:ligand-binding sensor domain-containing protein